MKNLNKLHMQESQFRATFKTMCVPLISFNVLLIATYVTKCIAVDAKYIFPEDFQFGVTTFAYQIEGEINTGEKTVSIIDDYYIKNSINETSEKETANSYNLWKNDVENLKHLEVDFYQFSISWSRVLHTANETNVNSYGISYYENLINALIANNIEPVVTIDVDYPVQVNITNENFGRYYVQFAKVLFDHFADKVKYWITYNTDNCLKSSIPDLKCVKKVLLAHADVYHLYRNSYKPRYGGYVSIQLKSHWFEPDNNLNDQNCLTAEKYMELYLGCYANPIFSTNGDFSNIFKDIIKIGNALKGINNYNVDGIFTSEEIKYIKNTSDFFCLNFEDTYLTKYEEHINDTDLIAYTHGSIWQNPKWINSSSNALQKYTPWAFRKMLNWIKNKYNNPKIVVTGISWSDGGELYDLERVKFLIGYLREASKAISKDKINLKGISYWSLIDGLTEKRGLYRVAFNSTHKTRTAKSSVNLYKQIIEEKMIPPTICD